MTGFYLNPPEHAMVLCVDDKSLVQALERTQPPLLLGLGDVEGVTQITVVMVRRLCSPPSTSPPARCFWVTTPVKPFETSA